MAVAGLVLGIGGIILWIGGPLLLLPALHKAREQARAVACMSNARQIGMGVIMYAQEHRGHLPPDLSAVRPYLSRADVFTCPGAAQHGGAAGSNSYVYVRPADRMRDIRNPAGAVIMYEPLANHGGRSMTVLYADGHAVRLGPPAAQKLPAELEARRPPPTTPGGAAPD